MTWNENGPVKVFIGTDEVQMLGARVLEHTIRKKSSLPVEVRMLTGLDVPVPRRKDQDTRTGFSFTRFMIPELCNFSGRAIYLDADMLVFTDIAELWRWPMTDRQQLLYVRQPPERKRRPQYSVFLVDCEKARWHVGDLVKGLDDGTYDYHKLVYQFSHIPEDEKADALPFRWNSLEGYAPGDTSLIHFTDMDTQPWVSRGNPNKHLFYKAVRDALDDGFITPSEVADAVNQGHVSPLLPKWVGRDVPGINKSVHGWLPPYFRLIPKDKLWRAKIKRFLQENLQVTSLARNPIRRQV